MHVLTGFGAHLEELHAVLLGNGVSLLKGDLALLFEVALGGHEYLADVFGRVGLNLLDPGDYVVI